MNTEGARPIDWPSRVDGLLVSPIGQVLAGEVTLNARAQPVSRTTGSRNLPKVVSAIMLSARASLSVRIARITAFMSPRMPAPLSANALATRPT